MTLGPVGRAGHREFSPGDETVLHREQRRRRTRRDTDLPVRVLDVMVGRLRRRSPAWPRSASSEVRGRGVRPPRLHAPSTPPLSRDAVARVRSPRGRRRRRRRRTTRLGTARRAGRRRAQAAARRGAIVARSWPGTRRRHRAAAPPGTVPAARVPRWYPDPSSRSWWAPATGAKGASEGDRTSTRSEWYACSLTCSHSSADSGPGRCHVLTGIATRPRSWTLAARRTAATSCSASPAHRAAAAARVATPAEWPARYGDARSAKSPIAARAASMASPSSRRRGAGSQASTSSHADASGSSARISTASSASRVASSGSSPAPPCSRTACAAASTPPSMR